MNTCKLLFQNALAGSVLALAGQSVMAADSKAPSQPGMNHEDMQMQGGSAPADARDPHAYAGGNTLHSGPYMLAPEQGRHHLLHMGGEGTHGLLRVDRLEAARSGGRDSPATGAYDAMARWGNDANRFVLKTEGEAVRGKLEESSTEALWSHPAAAYWDVQFGLRHDTADAGADRSWLAFGVEGLAPYWFEVSATAYLGEVGRTAFSVGVEYELLLTQRLVLQPGLDAVGYGRRDAANGVGAGLSSVTAGLRLRYEISRQFAPYLGVEWAGRFGETADLLRAADEPVNETRAIAGVRFWF